MIIDLNVKPLSVNQCWKGKRYKTDKYKGYEKTLNYLLPNKKEFDVDPKKPIIISIDIGFSNRGADLDNPIKPILDILQAKYGFNDSMIYTIVASKSITKKGDEFMHIVISNQPERA